MFLFPYEYLIYPEVGLKSGQNCRRSSVLKFLLPGRVPYVNENKKKKHKNLKSENFEKSLKKKKTAGDMVKIGSFP